MPFCTKCGKELDPTANFCPRCGAPVVGRGAAAAPAGTAVSGMESVIKEPAAQEYWIERIIAFLIDWAIVSLALAVLAVAYSLPYFLVANFNTMAAMFAGVFSFVAGIVLVVYFSLFESLAGTSLGKRAMGLYVRSRSGNNPNMAESFTRNISKIYWLLLFLDIILGLATSREYTQKLSDRIAGTYVVKHRAPSALP